MKKDVEELTDEETQSIENGDGINDGIYSPTYEDQCIEDLEYKQYCNLEYIGYLDHLVYRYAEAEKNLRTIENQIIGSIGKDSYLDMMDLICLQQKWLERDIQKQWEDYDEMNQYIATTENNSIKNKVA
jgi:hypothetical protein